MLDFSKFKSIKSLINYFHDEETCKQALAEARWGDDVICPRCGKHHCTKRTDGRFRCNECKYNFSCTIGTIFYRSKLPLQVWFIAMYLISSHKKSVSSLQIMRDCEVTQKTAWFMENKIRSLYEQTDAVALSGKVEMDEMYLGGRETNKHKSKRTEGTQGRSTKTKTPIFGMVQRDGKTVAMKVEDTKGATLMPIVSQFVEEGSTTYTDEANIYCKLTENGYDHLFVNHGKREYVRANDIHTNSIEGFWAHFKRVIFSTYHSVSKDYLQRYIDEQLYRWNTREQDASWRFEDMLKRCLKPCDYADVLSLSSVVNVVEWKRVKAEKYRIYAQRVA